MGGAEEGRSNYASMFKQSTQQKEARRGKLHQELSDAEEALGPAQVELDQFISEAQIEVSRGELAKQIYLITRNLDCIKLRKHAFIKIHMIINIFLEKRS